MIPSIRAVLPVEGSSCRVVRRADVPDRAAWDRQVAAALAQIRRGAFAKVVLARETTVELEAPPDPWAVAARLQEVCGDATVYCLEWSPGEALIGASPERIFSRRRQQATVEVLAGTRRKGREQELLQSTKEQREFKLVEAEFASLLTRFATGPIEFSETTLRPAGRVVHLQSQADFEVVASEDLALLATLHPSAALSGWPRKEALSWIESAEPFQRGFYCGALGWRTAEESDWIAVIRCCHLQGRSARLYAGTGIVTGSDPAAEWDELEAKIGLFMENVFRCGS